MALTRERILDTARTLLSAYGLGDLSMRRLAGELGVAPGALYYHVRNKQELLSLLAERLLDDDAHRLPQDPAPALQGRELAEELTATALGMLAALREVTDAAEVVSVALAIHPEAVPQRTRLGALLRSAGLSERRARWGAQTLLATVLGLAQQAQDRTQMLGPEAAQEAAADHRAAEEFGVRAVVRGLLSRGPAPQGCP